MVRKNEGRGGGWRAKDEGQDGGMRADFKLHIPFLGLFQILTECGQIGGLT